MRRILTKTVSLTAASALVVSVIGSMGFTSNAQLLGAGGVPEGYVYTKGTQFMCDGSPYYYGGTNCYYLTFKSQTAVDNVFNDCKDMDLNVMRVWGNIDAGTMTDQTDANGWPVFQNSVDGAGHKDGVYFQYFDTALNKPVVNEGEDGLRHLDYVIQQAEKNNIKLIITFTNYWEAFGGMDQYVKWAQQAGAGTNLQRDDFYTNETCKQWYKEYIETLLNHENYYTGEKLMDSESVFAWELANEPRCERGDQNCEEGILVDWVKEMSSYVKTIDPYHMVSVGDEGFFNYERNGEVSNIVDSDYAFYGAAGVDFNALMEIDTIDFGTPHFYVDSWNFKYEGKGENGGDDDIDWLKMHAESAQEYNKPVVLEEFGLKDKTLRDSKFETWFNIMTSEEYEYQGFNYWMIASYMEDGTLYPDYDQYTVYGPSDVALTSTTRQLIVDATAKMNAKNICNFVNPDAYSFDRSNAQDIRANVTMKIGSISGLSLNGQELSSGSDYTLSGDTITVKKDFLSKLELSEYTFKVLTTDGNKPEFVIDVDDSNVVAPTLSSYNASIDKNVKKCTDVSVTMNKNGSEFRGVVYGGNYLSEGTDYTVSGEEVTFKKSFLTSLEVGANTLVFDFFEGKDCNFVVNATDTTGQDEIDTFDSYESSDELYSVYSTNPSGNTVDLSLTTKIGSQALAYTYNIGEPNYCGVSKGLKGKDFSAYQGISLWMQGDGSGNEITIQLTDSNGNYWESYITLDFTGGKTINLPFENFKQASWQADGSVIELSKMNMFSIYAGGNTSTKSGTVYFDNITLYDDGQSIVETPYILETTTSFDAKNASDVTTKVELYGTSLSSISMGGNTLSSGSYSISGNSVSISKDYLSNLENGTYNFIFKFSDGTTDTLRVTVVNNGTVTEDAKVNTTSAEFDLNKQSDISVSVSFNGNAISAIGCNGSQLSENNDFTVNSDSIVLKSSYLSNLSKNCTYTVTFKFSNGNSQTMLLKVIDSYVEDGDDEAKVDIDTFDNVYESDYQRNYNGNYISVTGENGMGKIDYTVGSPNYAGVTKSLNGMNWSSGNKITFDLTSDVSGRDIVFQIRDRNGNYFECRKTVSAGTSKIEISLSDLQAPSWAGNATADFSGIEEYSLYIEQGSANVGSGTMYIDNLALIGGEIEDPKDDEENVVIDNFDNVDSSHYQRNGNGNSISVTGENGMGKIDYTVGSPNYAGVTKNLNGMSWASGNKIVFDITSDVSGRDIVFQIRDRNSNYFECRKTVSAGTSKIEISLSDLQAPSWAGNASADFNSIAEYSLYIEQGSANAGSGTMYIDNLELSK